jgi:hypothetical protein
MRNAYRVGNAEGNIPQERDKSKWEDNIWRKMYMQE